MSKVKYPRVVWEGKDEGDNHGYRIVEYCPDCFCIDICDQYDSMVEPNWTQLPTNTVIHKTGLESVPDNHRLIGLVTSFAKSLRSKK